jgi:hypothetical protein
MNRSFSRLLLCLALLWALPSVPALAQDAASRAADAALDCGAPEESVARILAAVLDGRLSREDGVALLEPMVQACREGLPPAPLAAKADEGLGKSVPVPVLRQALDRRLDHLRFARGLLAPRARGAALPPAALAGLAEALEAGLPREALAGLAARQPRAPADMFADAARVWAYLGRAGLPLDDGRAVAEAGLEHGSLTPLWLQFPRLAAQALQRGLTPQAVREAAVATLRDGAGPADAAARLGLTSRSLERGPGR